MLKYQISVRDSSSVDCSVSSHWLSLNIEQWIRQVYNGTFLMSPLHTKNYTLLGVDCAGHDKNNPIYRIILPSSNVEISGEERKILQQRQRGWSQTPLALLEVGKKCQTGQLS